MRVRREHGTERRDVNDVRVARIDVDGRDVLRFLQPYRRPRPPGIPRHPHASPCDVLPRMHVSPPPTHTTSAFFGSTAIAPIVPLK